MHKPEQILLPLDTAELVENRNQTISPPKSLTCSKHYPDAEIIKDFGSGINFNRKGLRTLLERILRGDKLRVVVAHRDRLARFGGEVIQFLVEQNGGEVVVLNETVYSSPEEELTADLLAILRVFSCRMPGLRRYRAQIKEDRNLSDSETESDAS